MSRGLGGVQTGLLAIKCKNKPINTYKLAKLFYQPHIEGECQLTQAQVKATYRALCSLEKRGKIESHGHKGNGSGGGGGFIWWSRLGGADADETLAKLELNRLAGAYALNQRIRRAMSNT
jgi:hypothetical protein